MDPIIILRKERERIEKDLLRLESEMKRLDAAIGVLTGHANADNEAKTDAVEADGPPFDVKRYGEWRRIVKYVLVDAGRFVSWKTIVDKVKSFGLAVEDSALELSVRNALYGLKAKKEAFIYKMPTAPFQQVWGWKEYYDTITGEAKDGYAPRV